MEVACRFQKAVLWPARSYDAYGQVLRGGPEELEVRWVRGAFEETDPQGNTIAFEGTVVVDQEVPVGSLLWLGDVGDWYGTGSEGDDTEVLQVVRRRTTPDLKARATRRTLGLMRWSDTLASPACYTAEDGVSHYEDELTDQCYDEE